MLTEEIRSNLARLINQSQDGVACHPKLIIKCQQLFKQSQFDDFFKAFKQLLQNLLIISTKNPHLDKIIDFITKFSTSLSTNPNTTVVATTTKEGDVTTKSSNETECNNTTIINATNNNETYNQTTLMEDENQFVTLLLDHLIEINKSNSDVVRFRSCQLLTKLMVALNNDQFIDEDLYDRLSDSLLERLKDVNSRVQVQAISAIYRLQDPSDKDCRISTAFLFLMQFDPNWQVRFQALSHIAFSKQTLPDIIDRVRDPHASVRRKALMILSEKVLIKFISIEKRLLILNYALKDEDESVTEACCKKLLPSWLAFKENDVCKLLKALDVVDATDTMNLMLDKLFVDHSCEKLYDEFSHILNEKHVIPSENLTAESAFYWSWVCNKIKSSFDSKSKTKKSLEIMDDQCNGDNENEDEYLDRLLPSLTEYCDYIKEIFKIMEQENLNQDDRKYLENIFITKKLISMFAYIDFSDPHGKKTLQKLCHDLFANHNYTFIFDEIMKIYRLVVPNLQQRINNIVELISDIKDPNSANMDTDNENNNNMRTNESTLVDSVNPGRNLIEDNEMEQDSPTTSTTTTNKLNPREIALKIAEIKFQKLNYKDEFDKLYRAFKSDSSIDINQLSELRTKIAECEEQITSLQDQLMHGCNTNTPKIIINTPSTPQQQQQQTPVIQVEEEEEEIDPIICIDHCLRLAICLLQDIELKAITPHIRSLFENLILTNISSVDEQIRVLAVRALNLICILKIDIAQKYVPLLLEMIQRDKKQVIIEAFKSLINCIMAYSLNRLVSSDDDIDEDTTSTNNTTSKRKSLANQTNDSFKSEASTKILSIMTKLLDFEDSEITTMAVEGFCKLFMTGHILSAKLFSKLLIMYYSPMTENDTQLRAILTCFLPQFAFFRSSNQLCVEESFMLTVKCLINAGPDNYLSEIDLNKVTEILFNLTNPKNLLQKHHQQRIVQSNNICHENIFRSICYEILKDDNSFKLKTYLKLLQLADLTSADYLSLKSIHELIEEVHDHIEDKMLVKTAKKLCDNVLALLAKKPEYVEEQKTKENETIISQTDKTKSNNETTIVQNSESDSGYTRNYKSGDLIDPQFSKLKKKTLTKEQWQKKTLNNTTIMNKTAALPAVNETNNETLQPKSIFKQKATTTTKKKVVHNSSDEDTSDEDTIVETKVKQAKLVSSNQSDNTDEDATDSDNENNNNNRRKSLRNSPRVQQQQQSTAKTTSSITITKINKTSKPQSDMKNLQIKLKRIELKEVQKNSTQSTTENDLRVQLLRSRSDKTKSSELNNESHNNSNNNNRSKSLNISKQDEDQNELNNKKTTSKRSIDTKSGKSNNRRAQSADVSHDQSTIINEDEPPVKKGRSVKSKKLDEVVQAATVTRTRSTSSRAKKQETIQVETEPAVRRSNRKSK